MTRITLLCENTARGMGILGEHGLCWWIDTGAHQVLFDAGQGLVLQQNAARLGIDLSLARAVVLSHGHLDHVGGLEQVLTAAPYARLHFHPDATCRRFTGSDGKGRPRRLSSDFMEHQGFLNGTRDLRVSRDPQELVPGLWSTGEIPRTNDFEDTGGPFFLDAGLSQPDPILDDQALFFHSNKGLVVILGCAHAGVVNTLDHIRTLAENTPIDTVLGGMHLERAGERRMNETIQALRRLGVRRLGPNHCTGQTAIARFWHEFPNAMIQCPAGSRFEFQPPTAPAAPAAPQI